MKLKESKRNLENKLIDVKEKILEIEEKIQSQRKPSKSLKDIHQQLKALYVDIVLQYDQVVAMETDEEYESSEIQDSIYTNIYKFNSVYTTAGGLINELKFSNT